MNIVGIGTDIVDISRLRDARHLARVAEFIFLPAEIADMKKSRDKAQFAASRLALKESVIKAYPGTLHYRDILIQKKGNKLAVRLALKKAARYEVFASIAHEFNCAIGYAILCKS